ncbi:hypothetical protein AYK20_08560 [Thermoplasmatales archaeon SG8-52-1]|nr:MAG: hypothetical protein AYK20_08560 [Thermoplasmatales archaeon SG8-52-1]
MGKLYISLMYYGTGYILGEEKMKKKIFVLLITLVMTSTVITIPRDINVIATVNYGNPNLDDEYILSKTEYLSNIVNMSDIYRNWGRFFGTPGERYAAFIIEDWMEEDIGLDCVHLETIDSTWDSEYSKGKRKDSLYVGELNKARNMSPEFYLNISVYENSLGLNLIDYKNLTIGECFPYYQHSFLQGRRTSCIALVVENFSKILPVTQMELCDIHYLNNETITNKEKYLDMLIRYVGYIVIDNSTDSFYQVPPVYDQNRWLGWFESQGFYVNGSVGSWIREYVHNWYHVVVKYGTCWKNEDVISYNVIGQINGTDTSKVNIVCAHYDAMPGQGTIDEGGETALVLGIAKYIKDHELESDLKHTVKFIAFGAEEVGIRGAKDYIVKHVIKEKENVSYVINPGNFGSYERNGTYNGKEVIMPFEMASDMPWLSQMAKDIANALDYTQQTTETGDYPIDVTTWPKLRAEDSMVFGEQCMEYYSEGCIQFGRAPSEGRHRDGEDHTTGDTFDTLDQDTFNIECEVVASVALHLLLNLDYQYENCTFTPVDLDGNGYNDSVNVTVNMSTNNNATLVGKSLGGLYHSTTGSLSSSIEDTSLIPLSKGEITTANLTLTLKPNKPAGNYKANLSLFDPLGDLHEECHQTFYLYPINRPYADFTFDPPGGSKSFDFTDESIPSPNANNIVSWNWSFGDGTYSELQNPSHSYENEDSYEVTLTVVDDQSLTDDITKTVIAENTPPNADFNMDTNVDLVNTAITFTSTSSDTDGNIVSTKWYHGDGTTSYGNSVQHSYSRSDKYTVTMEVTDNDGSVNSTSDVVYIAGALVDDSYPGDNPTEKKWDTIQEGIDDVGDNELVYVFNGEYTDSVTVDKPISIYGEEGDTFINNPFSTAIGVAITSDNTVVDGFTIENNNIGVRINGLNNTIIQNCNILNTTTGIKIENNAEGNMIMHCNFTNNTYGVYITSSDYNIVGSIGDMEQPVVADCVFLLNDYGVYLENADNNYILGCTINATGISDPRLPPPYTWGICLDNADNNTIALCDVFSASQYGMYLSGSINNSITSCIIRENNRGVYLSGSSDNFIVENNISDSSYAGVSIVTMSSTGNSVFWNDFIRNGIITQVQAEDFGTGNNWNATENATYLYNGSGEGNHWDDYSGTDSDGDGIGDTSYSIAGTANSEDDFPVMEEYGWLYKWF